GLRQARSRPSFHIGHYGSIFHNDIKSITWSDPPDATQTPSMSSAPSNQFHQRNIAGGYSFTPGTRLTVAGSHGRSTQNEAFLSDASLPLGLPASSADALIISTALDVKLTARPTRALNLGAEYRFDDQDNRTSVGRYAFYDDNPHPGHNPSAINAALVLAPGTMSSNVNI